MSDPTGTIAGMSVNGWARPLRGLPELRKVLSLILDLVDPAGFDYRLVGTGAALAQGVQLPTGDIDILVARRSDVDRFAAALAGFRCLEAPAWLPRARQYFTHFEVEEIDAGASTVEVPAETDTVECIGRGPWEHYVEVEMGRHVVPVVRLELRLVSELVRDRPDRSGPITEHLRHHGADLQLLRRSMSDRGIDPARQAKVLDQLQRP